MTRYKVAQSWKLQPNATQYWIARILLITKNEVAQSENLQVNVVQYCIDPSEIEIVNDSV